MFGKGYNSKPPTHKDDLLEKWRGDTRSLAEGRVWRNSYAYYGDFEGEVIIKRDKAGSSKNLLAAMEEAIQREIAYLESAAEVEG